MYVREGQRDYADNNSSTAVPHCCCTHGRLRVQQSQCCWYSGGTLNMYDITPYIYLTSLHSTTSISLIYLSANHAAAVDHVSLLVVIWWGATTPSVTAVQIAHDVSLALLLWKAQRSIHIRVHTYMPTCMYRFCGVNATSNFGEGHMTMI